MPNVNQQRTAPIISFGQMNIQNDFRTLMAQISFLSRQYITSVAADIGNNAAIAGRLYALPMKLIERGQLVFGAAFMAEILHVMQMHVIHLITLVNAMKAGEIENVNASTALLYGNANDISVRLSNINPFWDATQWRNLLYSYIAMTIEEAISLMSGNFEKNLDVCDRLLYHALFMGDYIAAGIIQYLSVTQRNAGIQRIQSIRKTKAAAK